MGKPEAIVVDPAEIINVKDEKLKLCAGLPQDWAKLKQIQTLSPGDGTCAPGAVVANSLIIYHNDRILKSGKDYIFDELWGLEIGLHSSLVQGDIVKAEYSYSLLRIDSLVKCKDDCEVIIKGQSHLTTPLPPSLAEGQVRIANIFVDYHSNGKNCEIFTIQALPEDAKTETASGLIPETKRKLSEKQSIKIVCWGNSVTEGGDASSPDKSYPLVFARKLKGKYPHYNITVEVVAVGGSESRQWLYPDQHPERNINCIWQRVVDAKPDLVTIEFVNDSYLENEQVFNENYEDILRRIKNIGAEIILITPHFKRGPKNQEYVRLFGFLVEFAKKHNLAVADVSSRWNHLRKEGLPEVTLLRNGYNHPDDRGHLIFAEELMKCFK